MPDIENLTGADATDFAAVIAAIQGFTVVDDFPVSPSLNQRVYHTGHGMMAFYDGTRWLSEQIFSFEINTKFDTFSSTNTLIGRWRNPHNGASLYIIDAAWYVTLSGSGNWTIAIIDTGSSTIAGITITATNATTSSINAVHASTNYIGMSITENSGTASIRPTVSVTYRVVLT